MRFAVALCLSAVIFLGCGKVKPKQVMDAMAKGLKKTNAPNGVAPPGGANAQKVISPLLPPGSVAHAASAQLTHSKAVGNRLLSLKPRIPLPVYARLWNQWQANDRGLEDSLAQIRSLESRCTCNSAWCSDCAQRKSLERKHQELAARNREIESLLAQYG